MYNPNEPHNRATLWRELVDTMDKRHKWIVARDLHMIELVLDRKGGFGKLVCGREKRT